MPSATSQTLSLLEDQNVETYLRQIARGNAVTFTASVDAEDLDEWDEWHLEIHAERYPVDDALVTVAGTVDEDAETLTFELTSEQTNLDLDDGKSKKFWLVIYSQNAAGNDVSSWLFGWLTVVEANVSTLDDPTPSPSASMPVRFLTAVTGYTGGGSTNLDGVTTVGLTAPVLFAFTHSTDGGRFYELISGTDAEDSPSIIRPDDYAASSNEKVWRSFL